MYGRIYFAVGVTANRTDLFIRTIRRSALVVAFVLFSRATLDRTSVPVRFAAYRPFGRPGVFMRFGFFAADRAYERGYHYENQTQNK